MKTSSVKQMAQAALFAALIFLGTYLPKIPIMSGAGYIHFGDGFIYTAAAILPPLYAACAGAVGGILADVLSGFALYAPATALIKALMAVCVSWMCRGNGFIRRMRGGHDSVRARDILILGAAFVAAGAVNIAGYFIADMVLYGVAAGIAGLLMNAIQSAAGIAVFFVAFPILSKAFR